MDWKAGAGIIALPIIGILVWLLLVWSHNQPVPAVFSQEGNLIQNNPGLEPGVWYLAYEEPGAPGLTARLQFDHESRCGSADMLTLCNISFDQGMRVHIQGTQSGNVVRVTTLTYVSRPPEAGLPVKLYYYNPSLDQGPGGAQCTATGLVAVERIIPQTTKPLTDAITLLLRGELSNEERAQGITTEFPLAGVALTNATIVSGIVTLTFADPDNTTGGGSCRVSILRHQIDATAKQFPSVTSVRIMPEELFQP